MATDWLIAIGTIVLAIATIGLAVVAAFQDQIRSRLSCPKLDFSISIAPPDCHKTIMTLLATPSAPRITSSFVFTSEPLHADCHYFRVRVSNRGNMRAEYVEIYASELLKQQADGSFRRVDSFLPLNLVWSHIRQPFLPAISPGMEKLCDLGHIIDPRKRTEFPSENSPYLQVAAEQTTMSFDVEVLPATYSHVIAPGKYRLTLLIGAANSKPIRRVLEITLTGKWSDDERVMFTEGIGIQVVG